jgi:hypothetical protein
MGRVINVPWLMKKTRLFFHSHHYFTGFWGPWLHFLREIRIMMILEDLEGIYWANEITVVDRLTGDIRKYQSKPDISELIRRRLRETADELKIFWLFEEINGVTSQNFIEKL